MLFRETIAVYRENGMKHTDALSEQNAEFSTLKQKIYTVTTDL
jgi:hypothetical protein